MVPVEFLDLLAAAEKLYAFRHLILSRANVAGYRQTEDGLWVCDPASEAFNNLGIEIEKAKKVESWPSSKP